MVSLEEERKKEKERLLMTRRGFLKGMAVTAGAAALGASGLTFALSAISPIPEGSSGSPEIVFYVGEDERGTGLWYEAYHGEPMRADIFPLDEGANGIWYGIKGGYPVVVIRLKKEKNLESVPGVALYEESIFAAFSGRCVHACCVPGWHKSLPPRPLYPADSPKDYDLIHCTCHDSQFDPYDIVEDIDLHGNRYWGARPKAGPADRALPLIPLTIEKDLTKGWAHHPEWYQYC